MIDEDNKKKQHPLETLVYDMASIGMVIDVSTVSVVMARASRDILLNKKTMNAYRIVAADVLAAMARQGKLTQHGQPLCKNAEDGANYFRIADQKEEQ